jgi:hypothetical protein
MVFEYAHEHPSQWATIRFGRRNARLRDGTLHRWYGRLSAMAASVPARRYPITRTSSATRAKHGELKHANEILKKAVAPFAQAELDRRPK